MTRYIIVLEVEDGFYREFAEQGTINDVLLEQLKLDLQDQLDEYDFQQLIMQMISPEEQGEQLAFVPRKNSGESAFRRFF
ncbi:MAG: hypothetical protein JW943_03945 [Deltaproteobacteria bacterium]|nr:hypothetical protein [Deltaproteobacteria bacterium]